MAISRSRVLVFTALALLAFDAGRSLWARFGYAYPRARWKPDPAEFAGIAWPPGADAPEGLPLGQRIYLRSCQTCHGPDGRGNGPAAPSMSPRPRDFTQGQFKYKSTAAEVPPTDDDLQRTVRDGLRASAMPSFGDLLSAEEIKAVSGYVRSLGPARNEGVPVPVPPRVRPDPASLERGKTLYSESCAACHGLDGRARNAYEEPSGRPIVARDLTAPWTFRRGADPEQLWLRLTTGLAPGAMPSFAEGLTPGQRWDVVNYVISLARTPPWETGGRLAGPGQDPDPLRRGEYLVHLHMCGLCHTQIDPTGIYRESGYFLAGGMRVGAWPHANFVSRNLTSDEATGLGMRSADEIARIIRNGRRPDRVLDPWGMPWFVLHALTDEDARAMGSYLKTLPPVRHFVPEPLQFGFVETLIGKILSPLPAAIPRFLSYADGDFADPEVPRFSRDLPQRALETAQWVVLAIGLVAFALVGPRPRSWVKAVLLLSGAALLALLAWLLVRLPQAIPPEPLAQGLISGAPKLDTRGLPPEKSALLERGAYLYRTTSCLFCHGVSGVGGNSISWKPFGTLYVRNITSDPETGIGAWTDAQVARAIRSGVSRHGRQLHWQGMIWDLLSNLDEEDLRAIVAYLRTLPAVHQAIPSARAPAADDCEIYTFYTRGPFNPGCQ